MGSNPTGPTTPPPRHASGQGRISAVLLLVFSTLLLVFSTLLLVFSTLSVRGACITAGN